MIYYDSVGLSVQLFPRCLWSNFICKRQQYIIDKGIYLGCYEDDQFHRDVSGINTEFEDDNDVDKCVYYCASHGMLTLHSSWQPFALQLH